MFFPLFFFHLKNLLQINFFKIPECAVVKFHVRVRTCGLALLHDYGVEIKCIYPTEDKAPVRYECPK